MILRTTMLFLGRVTILILCPDFSWLVSNIENYDWLLIKDAIKSSLLLDQELFRFQLLLLYNVSILHPLPILWKVHRNYCKNNPYTNAEHFHKLIQSQVNLFSGLLNSLETWVASYWISKLISVTLLKPKFLVRCPHSTDSVFFDFHNFASLLNLCIVEVGLS